MAKLTQYEPSRWKPAVSGPRRVIHTLFAVALVMLVAPFAWELTQIAVANWKSMYGPTPHVEVPWIDSAKSAWSGGIRSARTYSNSLSYSLPWRPSLIIGIGFAWALFMSIPLRRA